MINENIINIFQREINIIDQNVESKSNLIDEKIYSESISPYLQNRSPYRLNLLKEAPDIDTFNQIINEFSTVLSVCNDIQLKLFIKLTRLQDVKLFYESQIEEIKQIETKLVVRNYYSEKEKLYVKEMQSYSFEVNKEAINDYFQYRYSYRYNLLVKGEFDSVVFQKINNMYNTIISDLKPDVLNQFINYLKLQDLFILTKH
ncbi:18316_t:CDS:1, partial [Gigaspora rosea]